VKNLVSNPRKNIKTAAQFNRLIEQLKSVLPGEARRAVLEPYSLRLPFCFSCQSVVSPDNTARHAKAGHTTGFYVGLPKKLHDRVRAGLGLDRQAARS
jgi:hypothetical protein